MDNVKADGVRQMLAGLAGGLLLPLWLASMSLDDDRLCSSVPLCFGFAAVLLLAAGAMLAGARPARPTLTCLSGLAAGVYFLVCCLSGDMLSEIWRELPLILAAFLFYGVGYYVAQLQGGRVLSTALAVAVLVNVAYLFLQRGQLIPIEAAGRPAMSLAGPNSQGCTLFVYENFSAMFLMVAGGVLLCRPVWAGWQGGSSVLCLLVGSMGVGCSFLCGSESVWVLLPLVLLLAWTLWFIIRLYSEKHIGYGPVFSGIAILAGVMVLLGELLIGESLWQKILSSDTHGRTAIWSCMQRLLPEVPWLGHGAGATQWQLVPFIDDYQMPNYAHNEYLQAWVDYGVVGVGVLLAVLLSHLAAGFWSLASEDIDRSRRALVAASMLLLLSFASCAMFDFVWHNAALVGLCAFACGVLASPIPCRAEPLLRRRKWAAGYRPSLRPVRFLGNMGAACCCVACVGLAAAGGLLGWRLLPAWNAQWEYNSLCHARMPESVRAEFLERVMEFYPDPELVDHYVTLSPPAGRADNEARKEKMMRMALKSNPHQLYTVVMLVDLLGREERFAEAEALMRDNYAPGGLPRTELANWPAYYGINLLMWGQQRLLQGDQASALSMMEHALKLWWYADGFRHIRAGKRRSVLTLAYISARRVDVDMLHAVGVQKDDSWMQPMRPGGAPALYGHVQNQPAPPDYYNPYMKYSPLLPPKK